MKKINFTEWTKKLDIDILNRDYNNKFINYSNLNSEQIINKLKKIKLKNKEKEKLQEYEYLENLLEINNYYQNQQNSNFKTRKYKLLYFLYASYINYASFSRFETLDFFENENKIKWYAFKNGPVTNHYKWDFETKDEEINIKIDYRAKSFLEDVYKLLWLYSTKTLIEESHQTDPWKKFFKGAYYDEIDKEFIKSFFSKNPPFFIEKNNR